MVWSDWAGWYIPRKIPNPFRALAADRPYSSGYGGAPADRPYSFSGYGGAPVDRPYSFSGYGGAPADRPYFLSGYGGGPNRSVVKVPDIVPGKIPNPAPISGKITKSMVRYEAVASDPTAVWRIASATNYKTDIVQHKRGDFQKVVAGMQDQLNRMEDLRPINLNSTQEIQLMSTPEGNFKFPSTGFSAVVTGWDEDPLPCSSLVSSTWNHQNPSQEPALDRQWLQNPKEYLNQPQFKYQANPDPSHDRTHNSYKTLAKGPICDLPEFDGGEPLMKDAAQKEEMVLSAPTVNADLSSFINMIIEQMEQTTIKATTCTVDGHNVDWEPHQILDKTEDEADFLMKQGAFLYNFYAQTLPKSYHCFSRRLMLEYSKFSSLDSDEPFACKLNNPKHRNTYKQVYVHVLNYEAIRWETLPKFSMQFVGLLWILPPWPDLNDIKQYQQKNWRAADSDETDPVEPDQVGRSEDKVEIVSPQAEVEEQLLQISLQAVKGLRGITTYTLVVIIGGRRGVPIVDSDSTHNFIDPIFATQITCQIHITPLQKGTVTGGGILLTGFYIANEDYGISGEGFSNSFKVLPLKEYDLAWDCDWVYQHSPVSLDLNTRKLTIMEYGLTEVTLVDHQLTPVVRLLSPKWCDKLLMAEKCGCDSTQKLSEATTPMNPMFQSLQEFYADVITGQVDERHHDKIFALRTLKGVGQRGTQRVDKLSVSVTALDPAFRSKYIKHLIQLIVQWPNTAFHKHLYRMLNELGLKRELLEHGGSNSVVFLQSNGCKHQGEVWGENFFDPTTKKWTTKNTGSATCKRGFVQFFYEPINQIITTCMNDQKDMLWPMLRKLGVTLKTDEKELMGKALIKSVLQTGLPASNALLEMMTFHLSYPLKAQKMVWRAYSRDPLIILVPLLLNNVIRKAILCCLFLR